MANISSTPIAEFAYFSTRFRLVFTLYVSSVIAALAIWLHFKVDAQRNENWVPVLEFSFSTRTNPAIERNYYFPVFWCACWDRKPLHNRQTSHYNVLVVVYIRMKCTQLNLNFQFEVQWDLFVCFGCSSHMNTCCGWVTFNLLSSSWLFVFLWLYMLLRSVVDNGRCLHVTYHTVCDSFTCTYPYAIGLVHTSIQIIFKFLFVEEK